MSVVADGVLVLYRARFLMKIVVDGTPASELVTLGAGRNVSLDVLLL